MKGTLEILYFTKLGERAFNIRVPKECSLNDFCHQLEQKYKEKIILNVYRGKTVKNSYTFEDIMDLKNENQLFSLPYGNGGRYRNRRGGDSARSIL